MCLYKQHADSCQDSDSGDNKNRLGTIIHKWLHLPCHEA